MSTVLKPGQAEYRAIKALGWTIRPNKSEDWSQVDHEVEFVTPDGRTSLYNLQVGSGYIIVHRWKDETMTVMEHLHHIRFTMRDRPAFEAALIEALDYVAREIGPVATAKLCPHEHSWRL